MVRATTRVAALTPLLVLLPLVAAADPLDDALKGKATFDWHSYPERQKCRAIEGQLLADLKSAKFKCDLKPISNTASGAKAFVCTEQKGKREYLVFATMKACEGERKTQASNS